jgi:hypothetical protein
MLLKKLAHSNLIKLDFSPIRKCKKLSHLQKGYKGLFFFSFFCFLDHICPNWIKLDPVGFSPIKNCWYKKLSQDKNDYRTRAIIGGSWFEAALVYKPQILSLKNEEFLFLVHKLSAI